MDLEFAYQLLTVMSGDHEAWVEVLDVNSEGHAAFEKFLNGLEYFPESLRNFRGPVSYTHLDVYKRQEVQRLEYDIQNFS